MHPPEFPAAGNPPVKHTPPRNGPWPPSSRTSATTTDQCASKESFSVEGSPDKLYMSAFLRLRRASPREKVQARSAAQPQRQRDPLGPRKMPRKRRHHFHHDQQKRHQSAKGGNP